MKAKTKFLKMFYKMPEVARRELVINYHINKPMTLNVICIEVRNNTELGKQLLKQLGYNDD